MTAARSRRMRPGRHPELALELVRRLATGRYDALAGRYLHAEHDNVDELLERIDEVRERTSTATGSEDSQRRLNLRVTV